MKRTLALVLSILLLVTALLGCGAKGKLTGTWQATANLAEVMQQVLKDKLPDSVLEVTDFSVIVELTFRKDGTCTFTLQEASVKAAMEQLLEDFEDDFLKGLSEQMSLLGDNVSLEDILKFTGINTESLMEQMKDSILNSDIATALTGRMSFDGYYKASGDKLYISETEEIDEKTCFAFLYKIEDGVLTLPMIAGVTPMELALTAAICPLSFHKA